MKRYRVRRFAAALSVLLILALGAQFSGIEAPSISVPVSDQEQGNDVTGAVTYDGLGVKGRAPKTGYARSEFGNGWANVGGCDTRNIILKRDLINTATDSTGCKVTTGVLSDPYTAKQISFLRGAQTSDDVQIDHVVALSNAWQTGAQQLSYEERVRFANDPMNLLAVDGPTNENKSDGDAATWLPPNKEFRCAYVRRQVTVKKTYRLWVTPPERDAISRVLSTCGV